MCDIKDIDNGQRMTLPAESTTVQQRTGFLTTKMEYTNITTYYMSASL